MKTETIKLLASSMLIILSFFLGYVFAVRQLAIQERNYEQIPVYIDISTSKSSIRIKDSPKNIFFRVNGNIIQTGSIDLKE
ncbi:hypothetical protein GW846_00735 [Candidatus Gracilibacteria bacterium]|nr:hypothetical protein [Candidatus Gracilibacteria bacterium]